MRFGWIVFGIVVGGALLALDDRPTAKPKPTDFSGAGSTTAPLPSFPPSALPAIAYGVTQSHGYGCTADCSGHKAGYAWAERHDIDDPDDCGGNSDSFIEGCRAYAAEQGTADSDDVTSKGDDDE
jgi:hypothetical protein